MATRVIRGRNSRLDHLFFCGMAVVILVWVFAGFARSYYLAGVFEVPLPTLIVHIHGAAFSCRILFLIAQTSLVVASRVGLYRRCGVLGLGSACLVLVLGLPMATDQLGRHFASGEAGMRARAFYTVTLSTMLAFATLIHFAFRNRFNPAAHKRFILIATIAILDAAFQRWPVPVAWWGERAAALTWATTTGPGARFIAPRWASALVVELQQLPDPIGHSALWQAFAAWTRT